MKRRLALILAALLAVLVPLGCSAGAQSVQPPSSRGQQADLTISAAASLTDALNELKPAFEKENPSIHVSYNLGSSGKLAQQIEQGAPADVFLSASKKDMDSLQNKNLLVKNSRINFARNDLVLIARKDSSLKLSSFAKITPQQVQHVAIGEPESVPAGSYAKEVLERINLWNPLQSKLVFGKDVRQVLTYVESGNADLGIVYASDALVSSEVKVLAAAKPEWHQPIVYPAAVVSGSSSIKQAKTFVAYLASPKGKAILKKYGFATVSK